jgi:hypothetical protein
MKPIGVVMTVVWLTGLLNATSGVRKASPALGIHGRELNHVVYSMVLRRPRYGEDKTMVLVAMLIGP